MSTNFSRGACPDQESLVSFLYDEFDGSEPIDRRTLTKHVETCERCARVLASLGGVRQRLRAWEAPEMSPLAFRIASDSRRPPAGATFGWAGWMKPAFPLAAAAVLVVGAGLGLARVDVQYDRNGFRVRTGWSHDAPITAQGPAKTADSLATKTAGMTPTPPLLSPGDPSRAVTQQDIQTLAQTLRQEFAISLSRVQAQDAAARGGVAPTGAAEAAFFKRVQQMIDQSEVRQQQNLALRISEVSREFDVQKRSDMAQIEQGFARLAGQREQDVQQQRLLWSAIKASTQTPLAPR